MERRGSVLNVAAFLGHSSLRTWVMGSEATERPATHEELDVMSRILTEALGAGAIGFAMSTAPQHNGFGGVPMPSRLANDESDISAAANAGRCQVGREMNLAVLFADIHGFTSFAETHLPYDVVHTLNRYFDSSGAAIDRHDGFIDKYIGDGVRALFLTLFVAAASVGDYRAVKVDHAACTL